MKLSTTFVALVWNNSGKMVKVIFFLGLLLAFFDIYHGRGFTPFHFYGFFGCC